MTLLLTLALFHTLPRASADNVFEISSLAELEDFAEQVNAGNRFQDVQVFLTADITLNTALVGDEWALREGTFHEWTPIGTQENPFCGSFNGQNHVISGLYISNPEGDYQGLFGVVSGATIASVTVKDSYFNARNHIGAVVGYAEYSVIRDCCNSASVIISANRGGGIVGWTEHSTVRDCSAHCYCYSGRCSGGIVGDTYRNGGIYNCVSSGDVRGPELCGGISGGSTALDIQNCLSTANVDGYMICGGGGSRTLTNCFALQNENVNPGKSIGSGNASTKIFASANAVLNEPVNYNGVSYQTALDALNAWVDARPDENFTHWKQDNLYPYLTKLERHPLQDTEILYPAWLADEGNQSVPITVRWGWDTFAGSASVYDNEKAIIGVILSRAAEVGEYNVRKALQTLNFSLSSIQTDNYGKSLWDIQEPAYAFAHQLVSLNGTDTNVFAVVIRGTSEPEDWITDISAALNGFHTAADYILSQLEPYIIRLRNEYPAEETVFFITGHSLGGAVANIIATRLSPFAPDDKIFAYTSAAPKVSQVHDTAGDHIFNTINAEDVVPRLPPDWFPPYFWGYRYGADIPSPSFSRKDPANAAMYQHFSSITGGKDLKAMMKLSYQGPALITDLPAHFRIVNVAHSTDTYLAYLLARPDARAIQNYSIRRSTVLYNNYIKPKLFAADSASVPLNLEVYAADGELLGRVVNGAVDTSVLGGALVHADESGVHVDMIYDDENYDIRVTGVEDGSITIRNETVRASDGQTVEATEFPAIPLTAGQTLQNTVTQEANRLFALNAAGTPVSEIAPSGTATLLQDYNFTDVSIHGNRVSVALAFRDADTPVTLVAAACRDNGAFLSASTITARPSERMEIAINEPNAERVSVFLLGDDSRPLCAGLSCTVPSAR